MVLKKMKEVRDNCLPYSKDTLPACFYHIIDAIFTFPYTPELVVITFELSKEIVFSEVPPELSYLILDAMRTVYGKDFVESNKSMCQVAFASKLNWDYNAPKGSSLEDCGE